MTWRQSLQPSLRTAPLAWLFWPLAAACAAYAGGRDAGTSGVAEGLARLLYAAVAIALIYRLTRAAAEPAPPVWHRWSEAAILAVYFVWLALVFSQQVRRLDFSSYAIGYLGGERFLRTHVVGPLNAALGWEGWPAARVYALLTGLVAQFIIPLLPFLLMGYGARALGFRLRWWWLALPLSALTLSYQGLMGNLTAPPDRILSAFLFNVGIVGLTHELWARSLGQTRLEALLRHPLHGVALAAALYGLMHLPANVRLYGSDWPRVLALCLGRQAVIGFAYGYLWRRTRSLAPGVLWHALADSLN